MYIMCVALITASTSGARSSLLIALDILLTNTFALNYFNLPQKFYIFASLYGKYQMDNVSVYFSYLEFIFLLIYVRKYQGVVGNRSRCIFCFVWQSECNSAIIIIFTPVTLQGDPRYCIMILGA